MQEMQDLKTTIEKESLVLTTDFEDKETKEEEETASTSQFVAPRRKDPRAIRHSPFYRVLSELIDAGAASIQALRVDALNNQETGREAFLIHLDSLPEHHLFAGYSFEERHFSIDKTYRTSSHVQHGYAPIHYTESYSSETTEESITVHVYLNKQGQYLYSQIKKCSGNPEKITDLKIEAEQDELLKTNANTSIEVLSPLLNARQERYLKLKKEADELEVELTKLSSELQNHASLEAYKVKAKTFIGIIERLNQYTELADRRGRSLTVRLQELEIWSKDIQDAAQIVRPTPNPDISPDDESFEATLPVAEPKEPEKLMRLYKKLIKELQCSMKELAEKIVYSLENLQKIKKKHEAIQKTNLKFMALFEFPDDFLNHCPQKDKKLVQELATLTAEHEKEGSKLLKQKALQGNIKAVEDLFIMFESNLDDTFYKKLLNFLVAEKPGSKKEKLIKICGFFNANTEVYRIFVSNFSNQEKYIMQPQDINRLFSHLNEERLKINYTCEVSILFKLYCNNDLQSFQMLLEHGANPNTWGFTKKDNLRKALSIFNVITCWNAIWHADYSKLLLRYGANPNEALTTEEYRACLQEKISNIKTVRRAGIAGGSHEMSIVQTNKFDECSSPLVYFMYRRDLNFYEFLLPYMSSDVIAHAFAEMAINKNFNFLQFNSLNESRPPVKFFNKKEAAYEGAKKTGFNLFSSEGLGTGPFFNIFFYKNSDCQKEFEMLKMAYQTLTKRLKGVSIKQFDGFYQRLFKRGTTQNLSSKAGKSAYYCFSGCLFLLMAVISNVDSESERLDLIGRYYMDLIRGMQSVASARFPEPSEGVYKTHMIKMYEDWGKQIKTVLKIFKKPPQDIAKLMSSSEPKKPALIFSGTKPKTDRKSSVERKELKEQADSPPETPTTSFASLSRDPMHSFLISSSSQSFSSSLPSAPLPATSPSKRNLILTELSVQPTLQLADSTKRGPSFSKSVPPRPTENLGKNSDNKVLQERLKDTIKESGRIRSGDEQSSASYSDVYLPSGGLTRSSEASSSSQQHVNPKPKTKKKKKKHRAKKKIK